MLRRGTARLVAGQLAAGSGDFSPSEAETIDRLAQAAAFWPLNGTLADASGNGHTLVVIPTPAEPTGYADGVDGSANGALRFGDDFALTGTAAPVITDWTDASLSIWMKFTGDGDVDSGTFHTEHQWAWVAVYLDSAPNTFGIEGGFQWKSGDPLMSVTEALDLDSWHHYVAVKHGSVQRLYLDGELVATGTVGTLPFDDLTDQAFVDGQKTDTALVGWYGFALTAGDVAVLYNDGAGRNPYA
jgi:hypothetical protein